MMEELMDMYKRAGGKCQWCGKEEDLLANLTRMEVLCYECTAKAETSHNNQLAV